jgi:NAD(P)-dependent dehydrogenase (short-subunit alcohol dehydrogenase family)
VTIVTERPGASPRCAFITGAAGGIGKGIALHLAAQGYRLAISDISGHALHQLLTDIGSHGMADIVAFEADLAVNASVHHAVNAAFEHFGGLDVLVNCAGILKDARVDRMAAATFRAVLDVNLVGMLNTTVAALPALRASGSGRVISLTSRAWLGNYGSINYATAKGAIAGVSRSLALSLAADGITVNCIAPGFIETPMSNSLPDRIIDRVRQSIPVGRVGRPSDVARTVAFLAAAEAGYVTGQTITVCGGRSISGSMRQAG